MIVLYWSLLPNSTVNQRNKVVTLGSRFLYNNLYEIFRTFFININTMNQKKSLDTPRDFFPPTRRWSSNHLYIVCKFMPVFKSSIFDSFFYKCSILVRFMQLLDNIVLFSRQNLFTLCTSETCTYIHILSLTFMWPWHQNYSLKIHVSRRTQIKVAADQSRVLFKLDCKNMVQRIRQNLGKCC